MFPNGATSTTQEKFLRCGCIFGGSGCSVQRPDADFSSTLKPKPTESDPFHFKIQQETIMNMTKSFATAVALVALSTLSVSAMAASVRVKCETRSDRSKASIDGSNLATGMYTAVLTSGANSATSPAAQTVGDEVEFDFDSNPRDIRKGATPIAKTFIVNKSATGSIIDANGNVVATATAKCRAR